jgi:hypothetical protein
MRNLGRLLGGVLFSILSAVAVAQQREPLRPAVPLDPIKTILDAFGSHSIVALRDAHGNEQSYAFRLSLIRDPKFLTTVNDIVVESGNARYQDVMDRFIGGDEVPYDSLRQTWQNTTQGAVFNSPIYEGFFRAVRAVNASIPREHQLRVLLGDPPINGESVNGTEPNRDIYAADLIRREVLEKQRRALVIYGGLHFVRQRRNTDCEVEKQAETIVGQLESTTATKVFTIWVHNYGELKRLQADVATWRNPSIAILSGTALGATDFLFYTAPETECFVIRDGKASAAPHDRRHTLRMENQFDALLYLGPPSAMTIARPSPLR